MFDLAPVRTTLLIATVAGSFLLGWSYNDARRDAADATAQLARAKAARESEARYLAAADKLLKAKDDQIRVVTARLSATLAELRSRPARPVTSEAPANNPATCRGDGTILYREDAEFLAREAARADEVRLALRQCLSLYSEVADGRR